MTIAAQVKKLNLDLARIRWGDPDAYAASVPLRLHEHNLDAGGAPALAPAFLAWLRDQGVCTCEPTESNGYMVMHHWCDRKIDSPRSLRHGQGKMHARRLNRALRQVRLIAPAEFDALFLVVARGRTPDQAREQVNAGRLARGLEPWEEYEFTVLLIAGAGKLVSAY